MKESGGIWYTLALAAMPAVGTLIGGLLAEWLTLSQRALSLMLHAVAGMLLGVVGVELMPLVLKSSYGWLMMLLFLAGGAAMLILDRLTNLARQLAQKHEHPDPPDRARSGRRGHRHGSAGNQAAWVIFIGVAVDFITDGLMLVSGEGTAGIGLLLGVALLVADSPEAFTTVANMKQGGVQRRKRLMLTFSFPVILILGALLGEWLLRGQPRELQLGVLAFTAGIILTLVESEIIPQTFRKGESELATMILVGSFAGFALLSNYMQ